MPPADFVAQLDTVLRTIGEMSARSRHNDLSDLPPKDFGRFLSQAQAAVLRIAGPGSAYANQIEAALGRVTVHDGTKCLLAAGVIEGLQDDIKNGYVTRLTELIHGEVFGDFLEMAEHLLEEGYKDAAAVITGGVLEGHLRQLCNKHSIPVEVSSSSGVRAKKADQMNSDLAGATAYSKLDQKNVTAWLDLRNKAAHGLYDLYTKDQVALFLPSVRDFITRVPA